MKKRITGILLCCILMFTLTACQPQKKAVEAINSIGTVNLGSLEVIEYAESLYNALDVSEKVKVTNKNTLDRARAEYNRQDSLATDAQEAVASIGKVTLGSAEVIEEAREAYEKAAEYDVIGRLSESERTLAAAEKKLEELMQETGTLLEKAQELYNKGKYLEVHKLISPVIEEYATINIADEYGTLAVRSLCEYSQNEYNNGNNMNAMEALIQAMAYEDYCESSTYSQISKQISNYANGMNKFKPKHEEVVDRTQPAGRNTLKVTAGSYDTLVKVELLDNPQKYIKVFVEANKSATIYMQNGEYRVKYTCGPLWIDEQNMFGDFATFVELGDTMTMAGYTITKNKITTQRWGSAKTSLSVGYGNDFGYQNITPSTF